MLDTTDERALQISRAEFSYAIPDRVCVQPLIFGAAEQVRAAVSFIHFSDVVISSSRMGVSVEIHNTGSDPGQRAEITAHVEHALADRSGDWKVSIIGSQANDRWEMRILGPNGFERSYTLEGTAGETEPQAIGRIVAKMVPKSQKPARH